MKRFLPVRKPISLVVSVLLILLGLVVMLGWIAQIPVLVRLRADLAVMQFNTALSFVLAGAGLYALRRGAVRETALLGGLGAFLALVVLVQHTAGLNLGIDTLFVSPFESDRFYPAGRMSPPTALVFLAAGSSLFLASLYGHRSWTATAVGSLAAGVLSLGGLAVVSYVAGTIGAQGFNRLQGMAVHTAAGAVLLGVALLSIIATLPGIRERTRSVWIAGPVAIFGLTIAVSLWLAVAAQDRDRVNELLNTRASAFRASIAEKIDSRALGLERLVSAWHSKRPFHATPWPDASGLYHTFIPELRALVWVEPTRSVWLTGPGGVTDAANLYFRGLEAWWSRLRAVQNSEAFVITRKLDEPWSGNSVEVLIRVPTTNAATAFMLAVLDLERLIGPLADDYLAQGYGSALIADDVEFFSRRPVGWSPEESMSRVTTVDLKGGETWLLQLALTPALRAQLNSRLPELTLLIGLSFASLLAIAAHMGQRALQGQRETEMLNLQLARENEVRTWAEDHFRSLVDAAPNALLIVDKVGRITLVNAHTLKLFGYRRDELLGQSVELLVPTRYRGGHPGWRGQYTGAPTKRPMGTGRELHGLRKDGTEFPADISLSPLESREALEIICSIIDMSSRKRAEDELRRANSSLEAVNQELEAFSYSVSHDLRQPLRGMIGFGQILQEDYADRLDEQGRDCIQRIQAAAQRMGRLIDDLLSLSRVTRTNLLHEPVDFTALAQEVAEGLRRLSPERQVAVTIEPGLEVQGDPRMLRIMLENLLGNAWKFTGKSPEAAIVVGSATQDGERVFFVRDNGDGFDMAYRDQLFGAFQRLHTMDEFPGTGVGLATVQRIVHRHHGRIWAEAEKGKGATFFFKLG